MMPKTQVIGPVRETGADMVSLPAVPSLPALEQVREFIRASKAENTLRGYQSDWRHFCGWCETNGLGPLPASAEAVAAYIAECAGRLKVGSTQKAKRDRRSTQGCRAGVAHAHCTRAEHA